MLSMITACLEYDDDNTVKRFGDTPLNKERFVPLYIAKPKQDRTT